MTNFLWLYINKCKVASLCSVPVVIEMAAEDNYIAGWLSKLQCDCPQLTILVIGETGVGKSTLVNNLLGEDVAGVGYSMTSATSAVTGYEGTIEGVPVKVYDTPGLADSRSERDEEYLEEIKKLTDEETIHLIIYCLKMTETRMRRSIIRTFEQYTKIGVDWEKTVIAITFADALKPASQLKKQKGFSESTYFKERLAAWREEISRVLTEEINLEETTVARIRINPTTEDHEERLPNGEVWYIPFWLDVLDVLPPAARIRFVEIHKNNIIYRDKGTRQAPEWPADFHLPPPPKPDESRPTPNQPSMVYANPVPLQATTNVAGKEQSAFNVSHSSQVSDMSNLSISLPSNPAKMTMECAIHSSNTGTTRKTVIVLEGEERERFENALGGAVQTAAGVAAGGMLGAAGATVAGAVAAGAMVVPALPVVAVAAAAGALGAGVARLFGWW